LRNFPKNRSFFAAVFFRINKIHYKNYNNNPILERKSLR